MKESYLLKNTGSAKSTANLPINSSSIVAKNKQNNFHSIISFLSLLLLFFFTGNTFAQTTLWSTGFEVPVYSNYDFDKTTGGTFAILNSPVDSNSGSNCSYIAETNVFGNKIYDAAIITKTALSFKAGKFYVVTVYAKVGTQVGILRIMKSSTNTNAAMKNASGADIIFNPSAIYNVGKSSYVKYTAGFTVNTDENKYVGFQMYTNSSNNAVMLLDDISIVEYDTRQPENYCVAGGTQPGLSSYISNVTLNTLNQNNSSWGGYRSYGPAVSTTLIQDFSYSLSVTINNQSTNPKTISAWLDWNSNGVYDVATETVLSTTPNVTFAGAVTITNNILIPASAVVNTTALRVELSYNQQGTADPCNIKTETDVQDYRITIQAPPTPTITSLGSTSGCVGSSITITGTNLTGATAANVKIGGTPVASITSNSGTVIVAVIGTGTTGNVTVTTAGGISNSFGTFTVNNVPTQPSIIAGNTSPCQGDSVTYSITNISGLTYTWTFPSDWIQTSGGSTNSVIVTAGEVTGNITVSPSNICGSGIPRTLAVTTNTKKWNGSPADSWNDGTKWIPSGVPDATNCVIIPTGTTAKIMNTPDAFAKTVTIKAPTGNLELQSGKNLTVTDNIIVENLATFNIRDKASLVQKNNVANTGIVKIERVTQPISKLDYTYWSSPVTLASNFTLGSLSPDSPLMFSWIPTILSGTDWGPGNWQNESASTIMDPRKGYIVRAPNTYSSSTKTPYTATFRGTPNNGDLTAPISKGNLNGTASTETFNGTDENDEWNLIGNPYPSALDAAKFLNLPANTSVIDGTLYLWTHNSQPDAATIDPFYGDYSLNYTDNDYAVFNTTGGTATAAAYIGGSIPTGYIASGQSFFVKAATGLANNGTTANVTFNNNMRVGTEGKNDNFFKLTKNNKDESIPKTVTDIERHRIWLNLTNNSGAFSQTLVGYVQDATQGLDRSFDGESLGGNDVSFYSIILEAQLTIQGRALPFDENDQVLLGYSSEISGELSIRIDHIDGLFDTQNIYLEDKELSVIHNLKESPYVFKTEIGDFNDRFVLRYADKKLGTDTFNLSNSDEVIVVVNQNVTVQSSNQLIKNIAVFDLAGRKIDSYKKVNALRYTLSHLNKTTTGLIVKITLENDTVISKKIIY
jgi:hypothetical protein